MRKRESIILLVTFVIVFALASCVYGKAYTEEYDKVKNENTADNFIAYEYSIGPEFIFATEQNFENEQQKCFREYEEFVATAYCACEKCCGEWAINRKGPVVGSTGMELIPKYSIAVDPNIIPYGSILVDSIENEYRADDCGGAIKGNHIDIYFSSHEEALNYGRQTIELAIKQ